MRTGTMRPSFACACVAALNSLQKPMMLTPCWPRAGPTGGEGFAFPAGSCSLTIPVTFFAIFASHFVVRAAVIAASHAVICAPRLRAPPVAGKAGSLLCLLHLHEI